MKKLFAMALMVVGMTAFAQETPAAPGMPAAKMSPEERTTREVQHLTKALSLDSKQVEQVKQLLADRNQKRMAMRDMVKDKRSQGERLSAEARDEMKGRIKADQDKFNQDLKGVLTAEQFQKYNEMMEKRRAKAMERMEMRMN